jgi:hypothetical protein
VKTGHRDVESGRGLCTSDRPWRARRKLTIGIGRPQSNVGDTWMVGSHRTQGLARPVITTDVSGRCDFNPVKG